MSLYKAIERDHQIIIPSGDMTIQDKDRIFVTGNRVDMMLFHNYFKSRAVKSLLIVGAGRIAYYLLGILKDSRIDTKVIETNPEIASFFSEKSPKPLHRSRRWYRKRYPAGRKCSKLWCRCDSNRVDEENLITLYVPWQGRCTKKYHQGQSYQSPRDHQCAWFFKYHHT